MTVHLEPGVAGSCVRACDSFADQIRNKARDDLQTMLSTDQDSFDTAKQIGTVYDLFAGADLQALLNGFVDQARAMAMLFAAAGGLIDAQDEAVAAALGKAAQEPPAMQSLGLMGSIGSLTGMLDAVDGAAPTYSRVGPEDVSGTPERIVSGAQALDEAQFNEVKTRVSKVAEVLETSATQLRNDLGDIMGIQWQGEFANGARVPIDGLTNSALDLAGALRQVVDKADEAEAGFGRTRQDIGSEATALQILGHVSAQDQGPGAISLRAELDAEREAAEEQARAIMNTVYSPAVMRANLDELDFSTAYRVVSTSALGGPNGVDMANIWNDEGVIRPAVAGTPSAAAIATASETSVGGSGGTLSGSGGASAGLGATAEPTDAATEQALLVARGGVADGAGLGAGPSAAGTAGTSGNGGGGGVNAGTAAPGAGAPMMTTANARDSGATGTAGSGGRGSTRGAERGLGSGAGQSGGGAAASRMGGAARPGMPAGGAPGSGAASGRVGGMPMGMMGAAGAGQGSRSAGHRPASYLVNATNTSEILGKPVKVSPARIGARPQVEPTVDEGMASATKPESKNGSSAASPAVTPAQALVNKLRGR